MKSSLILFLLFLSCSLCFASLLAMAFCTSGSRLENKPLGFIINHVPTITLRLVNLTVHHLLSNYALRNKCLTYRDVDATESI